MIYQLGAKSPVFNGSYYVAPNATVIGDVELGDQVSVWFNSVIRADNDKITIGAGSNIQEACVLHVDPGFPLLLEERVTVGHKCMLHGCRIGTSSLIGINSVILNAAEIGEYCIIGANTLIAENKKIPPRSLVVGSPGRIIRTLTDEDVAKLDKMAQSYIDKIDLYRNKFKAVNI